MSYVTILVRRDASSRRIVSLSFPNENLVWMGNHNTRRCHYPRTQLLFVFDLASLVLDLVNQFNHFFFLIRLFLIYLIKILSQNLSHRSKRVLVTNVDCKVIGSG